MICDLSNVQMKFLFSILIMYSILCCSCIRGDSTVKTTSFSCLKFSFSVFFMIKKRKNAWDSEKKINGIEKTVFIPFFFTTFCKHSTVANPLFADFSGHRTYFCPKTSIYRYIDDDHSTYYSATNSASYQDLSSANWSCWCLVKSRTRKFSTETIRNH